MISLFEAVLVLQFFAIVVMVALLAVAIWPRRRLLTPREPWQVQFQRLVDEITPLVSGTNAVMAGLKDDLDANTEAINQLSVALAEIRAAIQANAEDRAALYRHLMEQCADCSLRTTGQGEHNA